MNLGMFYNFVSYLFTKTICYFQGGKDHASARYIYTRLSPITRFLFPKDDDILLNYLNEDGQRIEPTWYFTYFYVLQETNLLMR